MPGDDDTVAHGDGARRRLTAQRTAPVHGQRSHLDRIQADLAGGIASGVQGTPTFFINGARHAGSYDLETLLAALTSEHE